MTHSTLKTDLGFTDRDLHRLATSNKGDRIDKDSVPTFVLGTIISTIKSTYSNTPIFNLKQLDEASLLDLNPQSASQEDVSILMTSNKNAASHSNRVSIDAKASANFGGIFGAAAAAHYDHSLSLAHSDGGIYVAMNRGKHGSYYAISTRDLESGFDFTPFLIGSELEADEMKDYVHYQYAEGKRYIKELIFGGYEKSGQIDWNQRNVYGNIQLINQMETIFSMLLEQCDTFEEDKQTQIILYNNMGILKQKIGHAVRDFYAHIGTHFVSKLKFANYAYGYGTLQFDEHSGNEESGYGTAVSLSGGIPSKAAGEAGASASYAQKYGWAQAMKNLHIEAQTKPANVSADTGAFAGQIKEILNDQDKALSVPNLSMPASPKVQVLGKPDIPKKKSIGPPDSVFASYNDWKVYQKDLKEEKLKASIKKSDEGVNKAGPQVLIKTVEIKRETNLLEAYVKELASLKSQAGQPDDTTAGGSSNILRIENMFVSGFETTAYEAVIPSLRTSKIVLPKKEDQISTYPNATKLLLVINMFRQLADYTGFLSNFIISNISEEFAAGIDGFHDTFSQGGYDMMETGMSAGKDIGDEALHQFAMTMYGDSNSLLYQNLGSDVDRFNYVKYLLTPGVMYLWRDAPGGYAPFFFGNDQSLRVAALKSLVNTFNPEAGEPLQYALEMDLSKQVSDTPSDIGELYNGRTESPLYPVFRYELKHDARLLFLQCVGRYQLVYGKNGMISPALYYRPDPKERRDPIPLNAHTISRVLDNPGAPPGHPVDVIPDMDETVSSSLFDKIEGFETGKIDNNYALYFPEKTQTKELRETNRVILLSYISTWGYEFATSPHQNLKLPDLWSRNYAFSGFYYYAKRKSAERGGRLIKVDDGSKKLLDGLFPVLLPIDYSKISGGYGSLPMGSSFGVDNLIDSPTYDAAVITSMHG